jgi:hypothetical protein
MNQCQRNRAREALLVHYDYIVELTSTLIGLLWVGSRGRQAGALLQVSRLDLCPLLKIKERVGSAMKDFLRHFVHGQGGFLAHRSTLMNILFV